MIAQETKNKPTAAAQVNEAVGKYRWTICALLFFATTVNYLDRQVLSLLQPTLAERYNWTNSDYANITSVFQFVYAISMLFAGRIIDKMGTKSGYLWAIIIWSIGALMHATAIPLGQGLNAVLGIVGISAFSVSVVGFMVARSVLAFGEAGNFPAAIKATAEYFPKKERSFATGIFNSGANVGAILAPLSVPWIESLWGWEAAFIAVGAVGFLWIIFWVYYYDKPEKQKKLSAAELEYINSDKDEVVTDSTQKAEKVSWFKLLSFKQTWAFAFGKFMTDGVWWFFLFWLPAYLKAQYGMQKTEIMLPLAVLYSMTMIGSIGGGWFPVHFMKKGLPAYDARMKAMLVIALFPLTVLLAQPFGSYSFWVPVILIGIGASAHQAWSANIFTTVSDMFPKKAVGSIVGIGGMAGGIGGVLISKAGGWLFDGYRATGISNSWAEAKAAGLGDYVSKIHGLDLATKYGDKVDINNAEIGGLAREVATQLEAIDPVAFNQLLQIQQPLVQSQMTTAYTIMFSFCAVAYLLAWIVMKALVPRSKPVEI